LFNRIRIHRGVWPLSTKFIHVFYGDRVMANLSLLEIDKLPLDDSGYHILKVMK